MKLVLSGFIYGGSMCVALFMERNNYIFALIFAIISCLSMVWRDNIIKNK